MDANDNLISGEAWRPLNNPIPPPLIFEKKGKKGGVRGPGIIDADDN